jgi:2-aminoadipate transaminase
LLEDQIKTSRELYARKAQVMLDALEHYMPRVDDLWWSQPKGGMFLWLHLPDYMDSLELLKEAVEQKVAYVVGSCFYTDGGGHNEMRLNYSYPTEEQIVKGVKRMPRIVKIHACTDNTAIH